MNRKQRYTHEMLVRVRDFGAAHPEQFPRSSPGGERFAQVAAAVEAVDEHVKNRALGKAGARGVKASTRAAVSRYMKTIAKAARRITRTDRDRSPFRLPRQRSLTVEVGTARAFLEEAEKRQADFVGIGLPATFISEFAVLVNDLSQAADVRLSSKTMRANAQAGIVAAIARGLDVVRDLDVIVEVATSGDPVLAATWRAARRIEAIYRPASDASRAAMPGATAGTSPATAPVMMLDKAS